eukprot:CAMPEP_0170629414 /NCGR_PEP_ID=MMETSP0224-20130122/33344_1 /TAXON_ID=285029 /ORGANISM="Togula jolla, Strain CCCM 725" /LENGTH=148 /DNA_ID=CAMNT_0010957183 /DNA_START=50 /DNA_END=492 /DNA_ORIENTATION=+
MPTGHVPTSLQPRLRRVLPFCKNWKTAVATSTFSGFLSGCHFRSSVLNSLARFSFDSIFCISVSFFNASIFASLISFGSPVSFRIALAAASAVVGILWNLLLRFLALRLLCLELLLEELTVLRDRLLWLLAFLRLFELLAPLELLEEA